MLLQQQDLYARENNYGYAGIFSDIADFFKPILKPFVSNIVKPLVDGYVGKAMSGALPIKAGQYIKMA